MVAATAEGEVEGLTAGATAATTEIPVVGSLLAGVAAIVVKADATCGAAADLASALR
jgi:hypothetical protein